MLRGREERHADTCHNGSVHAAALAWESSAFMQKNPIISIPLKGSEISENCRVVALAKKLSSGATAFCEIVQDLHLLLGSP